MERLFKWEPFLFRKLTHPSDSLSCYDPFQDHTGVHRVEQSLGEAGDESHGPEPFPVPSGSSLVFTAQRMN